MKLIYCAGRDVVVDNEDFDRLKGFRWRIVSEPYDRPARTLNNRTRFFHHDVIGIPPKGMVVDHINGNAFDNRKENLRFCTHGQNSCNQRRPRKANGAGKGVFQRNRKWMARVCYESVRYHLGHYDTIIEAELAYDAAALFFHGEFARLNHPHVGTVARSPEELRAAPTPLSDRTCGGKAVTA